MIASGKFRCSEDARCFEGCTDVGRRHDRDAQLGKTIFPTGDFSPVGNLKLGILDYSAFPSAGKRKKNRPLPSMLVRKKSDLAMISIPIRMS